MIIKPVIKGVVSKSAHPEGCRHAIMEQIKYCQSHLQQINNGPKRVLILGASSGFGLAARISLTFGGAKCDSIGVSFEKGPSEKSIGTAGWYNNIFFKEFAEAEGRIAHNVIGDAFSDDVKNKVLNLINKDFDGEVDLIIYSLATGQRSDPATGNIWRSCLKTTGSAFTGKTVNIEDNKLESTIIDVASEAEIADTIKVMGGDDWESWILWLKENNVLTKKTKTIAFSYIGPEMTYPIYHTGTLGKAKQHLHETSDRLNKLISTDKHSGAYVVVCKALVTKASVYIPCFSPYILCLYKVMKSMGLHETCIGQMHRLFTEYLYNVDNVVVDSSRLIRIDDLELREDVQQKVIDLMSKMNDENFTSVGDYIG
ncbi:TPA: enoyl-ACP reductase FabV, partial [Escherichia coli]